MPSKKVYLKCNRPFVHGQITSEEAKIALSGARKSIGSYFANKNTTKKGTGLTDEEVKLLLPSVLDTPAESLDFRKEVDRFYTDLVTMVPYNDKGRELEIGLELDNSQPVTYFKEVEVGGKTIKQYNSPINVEDYVRYKHALSHPHCAPSYKQAKGNSTISYYIEDPDVVLKDQSEESDKKDNALNLYQQIKDDPKKVKAILSMLTSYLPKTPGKIIVIEDLAEEQRKIMVRDLASGKHFAKFYDIASDEKLLNKYLLSELIRVGLLKLAGTSVLTTDGSNAVLGITREQAVDNLFYNPANAQLLASLKAEYKTKKDQYVIGK